MTPYPLDASFERALAATLVTSAAAFNRVGMFVQVERLSHPCARLLVAQCKSVFDAANKAPGSAVIVLQRLRALHDRGKITFAELTDCAEYLDAAMDAGLPDPEIVVAEISTVLRRVEQEEALDTGFTKFASREGLTDIAKRLERAENIGKTDLSYGVGFDGFAEELEMVGKVDRLPMGFADIDAALGGGMSRGELGFFLAGGKVGKSAALVQVAAMGLYKGLNVAVATLELDEIKWRARILGTITGTPYQDILRYGGKSEAFARYAEMVNDKDTVLGNLTVRKFSGHQTMFAQVVEWLDREQDKTTRKTDLLVIDYADKLTGNSRDDMYTQMRDVYEGIRLWAAANNTWAWTASQTQRIKEGEMPTVNSCADSQHKVRVTDLMCGITKNPDTFEVMAKLLAVRSSSGEGTQTSWLPGGYDFGCLTKSAAFGVDVAEALASEGDPF